MKKEVFRQAAIDRISTPEDLDETLTVTRSRDWLALTALALMLSTAIVWGERGRIFRKVDGQGVLVLEGGVVNVFAEGSGRVRSLDVKIGDRVVANQVIGSLTQPALDEKLRAQRENLAEVQRERDRGAAARITELRLRKSALANQRENLNREISDHQQQIKILDDQLQVDEELLAKGLITRQQLLSTRQKRVALESGITAAEAQLRQIDVNQFQGEAQAAQTDREAEARVSDLQRGVTLIAKELAQVSLLRTPYAGKVIELKVYAGAQVVTGEPVLSLEPAAESVAVILYVSAAKVKEIQAGMAVEVSPTSVQREEFGFLRGKVVSVAEFPATRAAVLRNFENDSLATALASAAPVNEVRVQLERDPSTISGFRWSSSKGPPVRITSGTLCTASIITRSQTPLSLVIPALKEKAGWN